MEKRKPAVETRGKIRDPFIALASVSFSMLNPEPPKPETLHHPNFFQPSDHQRLVLAAGQETTLNSTAGLEDHRGYGAGGRTPSRVEGLGLRV